MSRVPLMRVSIRLPLLPITQNELKQIWDAVRLFPITGNPVVDYRLIVATGRLESAFASPTIMPPNGESSALGYFQIIKSVRNNISKRIKMPWSDSMFTQACFSAYGYAELAKMLRTGKLKSFSFYKDPFTNYVANIRFRYIIGTGDKYLNHRDALSFPAKFKMIYNYLALG